MREKLKISTQKLLCPVRKLEIIVRLATSIAGKTGNYYVGWRHPFLAKLEIIMLVGNIDAWLECYCTDENVVVLKKMRDGSAHNLLVTSTVNFTRPFKCTEMTAALVSYHHLIFTISPSLSEIVLAVS